MSLRPLGNRILVLEDAPEEVTAGGIYIPATAQKQQTSALAVTVVAVGPGKDGVTIDFKAGDSVLVEAHRGQPVKVDGVTHLIVDLDSVLGVVEA